MTHQILQQVIPTAQDFANWGRFSLYTGGAFVGAWLFWTLVNYYLWKLEDWIAQQDADAATLPADCPDCDGYLIPGHREAAHGGVK